MDKETLLYKRPFDLDPYLESITATVTSCTAQKEGFAVALDRTIFFPRGGGQPCDGGFIDGFEVLDVYEENGRILHILGQPLEVGAGVTLKINIETRRMHMQHHLAQHIISAIITNLYQNDTIIARIEPHSGHIELPHPLTPRQLGEVEAQANLTVQKNLAVKTGYYTPQEAQSVTVRGKITPHELIRLVTIEGFDVNACGGTHCRSTGEIEDIAICGVKEVRGVFRVYYKAGLPAREEKAGRLGRLLSIQSSFGCEDAASADGVAQKAAISLVQLEEQSRALRQRLEESEALWLESTALKSASMPFIAQTIASEEVRHYKAVCDRLVSHAKACVLLALTSPQHISLIFMRPKGAKAPDLGLRLRQLTETFGGKGGGSPVLAQGMIPFSEEAISHIERIADEIREEIK